MLLRTVLMFFCFSFFLFPFDGVAAIVGDEIILESAVQEQVSAFLLRPEGGGVSPERVREKVLDYLVEQEVLTYFAKKDSLLHIEDSQVKQVVNDRLMFFKEQLGSVAALESYFGVEYLEIEGLLKKEAEKMLLSEQLKRKLFSYVSISTKEVEKFYSSYQDSLPLTPFLYTYSCFEKNVSIGRGVLDRTQREAQNILDRVLGGESFESFYSSYSGGDLGFFRRGTFIQEFEEVAFSLKEGDVVGPILSSLGFHLIRLNRRLGEKVDASHILFPIQTSEEDVAFSVSELEGLRKTLSSDFILFDSLSLSNKGSYGGVFSGAPENIIPPKVLQELQNLPIGEVSGVVELGPGLLGLVLLKKTSPPSVPDLYEYWEFVENMALEKKFYSFYLDWYNKNKEKVYINILK